MDRKDFLDRCTQTACDLLLAGCIIGVVALVYMASEDFPPWLASIVT